MKTLIHLLIILLIFSILSCKKEKDRNETLISLEAETRILIPFICTLSITAGIASPAHIISYLRTIDINYTCAYLDKSDWSADPAWKSENIITK